MCIVTSQVRNAYNSTSTFLSNLSRSKSIGAPVSRGVSSASSGNTRASTGPRSPTPSMNASMSVQQYSVCNPVVGADDLSLSIAEESMFSETKPVDGMFEIISLKFLYLFRSLCVCVCVVTKLIIRF